MTVAIRRARPADLDFIVDLVANEDVQPFLAPARSSSPESILADIRRSQAEPEAFGLFVIEVDGRRAGTMRFVRSNERHGIADLGGPAVHPAFPGAKVAVPVTAPSVVEQVMRRTNGVVARTKTDPRFLMTHASHPAEKVVMAGDMEGGFLFPELQPAFDGLFERIPVVSSVYDLTKRFTAIVDPKKQGGGITDMMPVWCFFGGEPGAAVLALQVAQKTVIIGDEEYIGVMIPSSPVPVGGALLYVPKSWIRPAADKMDDVMAVYVSMGVTPPKSITAEKA